MLPGGGFSFDSAIQVSCSTDTLECHSLSLLPCGHFWVPPVVLGTSLGVLWVQRRAQPLLLWPRIPAWLLQGLLFIFEASLSVPPKPKPHSRRKGFEFAWTSPISVWLKNSSPSVFSLSTLKPLIQEWVLIEKLLPSVLLENLCPLFCLPLELSPPSTSCSCVCIRSAGAWKTLT